MANELSYVTQIFVRKTGFSKKTRYSCGGIRRFSSVLKPEIISSLEVCTIANESFYNDIAQADISTF